MSAGTLKQHAIEEDEADVSWRPSDVAWDAAYQAQARLRRDVPMAVGTRKEILIVEDEEDIALLLKDRLELAGHIAHVERTGHAGLVYAMKHRPDLVILDLMLPDVDGYEVCQLLRNLFHSWIMPVLMLTARDKAIDQIRGFARGADAYLTKPYDPDELLQTVSYLLGDPHVG